MSVAVSYRGSHLEHRVVFAEESINDRFIYLFIYLFIVTKVPCLSHVHPDPFNYQILAFWSVWVQTSPVILLRNNTLDITDMRSGE